MNIDSLNKLYVHELKDLYSAENQILKALPKMIDKCTDDDLRDALENHRKETETQVTRIQNIFKNMDFEPGGHKCKGIEGLITEGDELLGDVADESTVNAAIVSACQRIEHYEIAAYGVARAYAQKLGRQDDVKVLTQTLEEEGKADRSLTQLAETSINFLARAGA